MAHGRDAARDITRGRQGGRWANHRAGSLVDDLAAAKDAHISTAKGCECRLCRPDLHREAGTAIPLTADAWAAAARMAHARLAAGKHLTDIDREAIRRHPSTPSLWPGRTPYGSPVAADQIPTVDPGGTPAPAGTHNGPAGTGEDHLTGHPSTHLEETA